MRYSMEYSNYAKIRDLQGFTDYRVSQMTHITPSTFSDWKSGRCKPKTEKLQKIANALGVTYAELIGIEKTPAPKFEPEFHKVISLYSQLNEDERQLILDTMSRFVASHK